MISCPEEMFTKIFLKCVTFRKKRWKTGLEINELIYTKLGIQKWNVILIFLFLLFPSNTVLICSNCLIFVFQIENTCCGEIECMCLHMYLFILTLSLTSLSYHQYFSYLPCLTCLVSFVRRRCTYLERRYSICVSVCAFEL